MSDVTLGKLPNVDSCRDAISYVDGKNQIVFTGSGWCSFDHRDIDHWHLLPLEEKGLWNV